MRFSSGLFLQQSVARGGAILEGDGELTLPPVLQPVVLLPAPINPAAFPVDLGNDSFLQELNGSATGAQASLTLGAALMGPGLWHVNISWSNVFSGTNDFVNQDFFDIIDNSGVGVRLASKAHTSTVIATINTFEYWFSLRNSARIRLTLGTTVALDNLVNRLSIYAQRMM